MIFPRLAYRARQFWNALLQPSMKVRSENLQPTLSTSQIILFRQMQPSEQVHAYRVFCQLKEAGETDPDLLAAALLHDVGKILSPLSIFDRVLIVLGKHFFPKAASRWGSGSAKGAKRAFVVAACHADWGADLAKQAKASDMTVELVRSHQEARRGEPVTRRETLLAKLQEADDGN